MTKLRRGFKKEAEDYASEFRAELGIEANAPLSPFRLAEHLAIPITGLSRHPSMPDDVIQHFSNEGFRLFSATTIARGSRREILHNDFHSPVRQNSNIAHEIAHILLGHEPRPPLLEDCCRHFDPVAEKEASELGYTLLVPKQAALRAVEGFTDMRTASSFFDVSQTLLRHRINLTNARKWARNRKNYSASRW